MLDLVDYRRRVSDLYQQVRAAEGDPAAWATWRRTRDDLFRTHPQSALEAEARGSFSGLRYFPYDPAYRLRAQVNTAVDEKIYAGEMEADGFLAYRRFGQVHFEAPGGAGTLSLYWIMGYGGGLFLPFGDASNGQTTYGAGRYLYDTIKGADLGTSETEIVLDFNYAYHPSCVYSSRWVCPLAPPENKLSFAIEAGERL